MDRELQLEVTADSRRARRWLMAIGAISIILGIAALLFPWWATLGIELLIGAFLATIGILELIRVLVDRPQSGFALSLAFAVLAIVTGGLLLMYPLEGMLTLTLVLTIFFLLGGIAKSIAAFTLRPAMGWGWLLASGVISILLGLIVLLTLPGSAFWVLGALFGIDLLFFGAAQIAFATAAREISHSARV